MHSQLVTKNMIIVNAMESHKKFSDVFYNVGESRTDKYIESMTCLQTQIKLYPTGKNKIQILLIENYGSYKVYPKKSLCSIPVQIWEHHTRKSAEKLADKLTDIGNKNFC